jgi:hypothetical protein
MQGTYLTNFHTIIPPETPSPPEHINVTPDLPCEGESVEDMPTKGVTTSDDITQKLEPIRKHKWNEMEDIDVNEPWKMCGIHTDYKHLHDNFSSEKEDDETFSMEEVYAIIARDE